MSQGSLPCAVNCRATERPKSLEEEVPMIVGIRDGTLMGGGYSTIAEGLRALELTLQAVDSPRVGLTLDVGNLYWYGHPLSELYRLYERFGPFVKHTHVKNIAYPAELQEQQREIGYKYGQYSAPLDEGDIDLRR